MKGLSQMSSLPPQRFYSSYGVCGTTNKLIVFGGSYQNGSIGSSFDRSDAWRIDLGLNFTAMSTQSAISSLLTQTILTATSSTRTLTVVVQTSLIAPTTLPTTNTVNATSAGQALSSYIIGTRLILSNTVKSGEEYTWTTVFSQLSTVSRHANPLQTTVSSMALSFDYNDLFTKYIVYVAGAGIVLAAGVIGCGVWLLRRSNTRKRWLSTSTTTAETDYSTTTSSISGGGTTIMNDQTEFAIPAFLMYKAGAEFRWHKQIAKGGGGTVYLGDGLIPKLQEDGPTIIVKVVGEKRGKLTVRMAQAFDQEISVMYYMGRHKNIAGLLGWCDHPMSMLMKFYSNGALEQFIQNGRAGNKALMFQFSLDISLGLQFMHTKGVAHCDMKPANILVDQDRYGNYFCALTDFGIAQMYSENAHLVQGFKVVNIRGASIAYAAPEVVTRYRERGDATKELAFAGDIYSFGMIMFTLVNIHEGW